jgi:hypothetical protein
MNWSIESSKKYNASENGKATRKKYHTSDSYKKISDEYRFSNKGKSTRKKYRDLWYKTEKGRKYSMWQAAKLRAKKKSLDFAITIEDIQIPEICPLLQLKLSCEEFGIRHNSPSLDRKDNKKGYTKDNVWVISSRANILKNNASLYELETLVKNLKLCGYT